MKAILALIFSLGSLLAAGTSITSITCTGSVATVTVANTLIANQGFEITGSSVSSYNINGTAVSANSTSFTFKITCNGSATGGTFQPAWQYITLSIVPNQGGFTITDAFWLTTTTPVPCASCTSQVSTASAAQIAAIQAGTTIEQIVNFPITSTESPAQMNTQVTAMYNQLQASFNAGGLTQYTGYCGYGTTWSAPPCP